MRIDARQPLSDEERVGIQVARTRGGVCVVCGRGLGADEPVWIRRLHLLFERGQAVTWRVPAGLECVAPEMRRATERTVPERCITCGRGVYYEADARRRGRVFCSRACRRRADYALQRERGTL